MQQDQASRFLGKKLMTFNQACGALELSRASLYNYLKDKRMKFPRPIKLANGRTFFMENEVAEWIASQQRVRADA